MCGYSAVSGFVCQAVKNRVNIPDIRQYPVFFRGNKLVRPLEGIAMYPCPCCGYEVFGEPPGSYEICPICYWEDDIVQLAFPDLAGGANSCSLIDGQKAFAQNGACESRFTENVRVPKDEDGRHPSWRSLDPQRDQYLKWDSQTDREKWQGVKDSPIPCLYYWSSEYWLAQTVAEQTDEREPE